MQFTDAGNLSYTASKASSVEAFEQALTAYLAAETDTLPQVEALLSDDPLMPMGLCLRGYLLQLASHPNVNRDLESVVTQLQQQEVQSQLNDRERQHVQALKLWSTDQADVALECLEALLQTYPMDMLALRLAHHLHFYTGLGVNMRDSTARVLDAWPEEHPQFAYLLGMHAFGLEEAGDLEEALNWGQQAVALNKQDIWAAHAVAHVFWTQGKHEAGLEWLQKMSIHWQQKNNFKNHLVWHGALHYLALGKPQMALEIYDEELANSAADDFYLDMCNNAALLLRLQMQGLDIGERWQPLAEVAARHVDDQELVFASVHYLLPLVAADSPAAQALLASLQTWGLGSGEQAQVCAQVGYPLAQALYDFYESPVVGSAALRRLQGELHKIGGSIAQRDLFVSMGQC